MIGRDNKRQSSKKKYDSKRKRKVSTRKATLRDAITPRHDWGDSYRTASIISDRNSKFKFSRGDMGLGPGVDTCLGGSRFRTCGARAACTRRDAAVCRGRPGGKAAGWHSARPAASNQRAHGREVLHGTSRRRHPGHGPGAPGAAAAVGVRRDGGPAAAGARPALMARSLAGQGQQQRRGGGPPERRGPRRSPAASPRCGGGPAFRRRARSSRGAPGTRPNRGIAAPTVAKRWPTGGD